MPLYIRHRYRQDTRTLLVYNIHLTTRGHTHDTHKDTHIHKHAHMDTYTHQVFRKANTFDTHRHTRTYHTHTHTHTYTL